MATRKIDEIKTDKVKFARQDVWIFNLIGDDTNLLGFFVRFQFLFGGLSKKKGIHLSQIEMAEHMKVKHTKFKESYRALVKLGILSTGRKSTHPRAGSVTFINEKFAGEFDQKAASFYSPRAIEKPQEAPALPAYQEPTIYVPVASEPSKEECERAYLARKRQEKREADLAALRKAAEPAPLTRTLVHEEMADVLALI